MDILYVLSSLLEPSELEIGEKGPVRKYQYDFNTTTVSKVYIDLTNLKNHNTLISLATIDPANPLYYRPISVMNQTLTNVGLKSGDAIFVTLTGLVKESILAANLQSKPLADCIREHGTDYGTPYGDKLVIWSVKSIAAVARSQPRNVFWRQQITGILLNHCLNYIKNRDKQNTIGKAAKAALRIYVETPKPADMTSVEAVNLLCLALAVNFDSTKKIQNYFGNQHIRPLLTTNFLELVAKRVLNSIGEPIVHSTLANFFARLEPNHDSCLIIYDPAPFRTSLYKIMMNPVLQGSLSSEGWMGAATVLFKVIMPTSINRNNITSVQPQSEFTKMVEDIRVYVDNIYPTVLTEWPVGIDEDIDISPLSGDAECLGAVENEMTTNYIKAYTKYSAATAIIAAWSTDKALHLPYGILRAIMHPAANKYSGEFCISETTKSVCMFGLRVNSPWVFGYESIDHAASIIITALTNIHSPMLYKKTIEHNLSAELKTTILAGLGSGVGPYEKFRRFLSKNREIAALFMSIAEIVRLLGTITATTETSDSDNEEDDDDDDDDDNDNITEMIRNAVLRSAMARMGSGRVSPPRLEMPDDDDDDDPAL